MAVYGIWDRDCHNDILSAFSNGDRDYTAQAAGRMVVSTVGTSDAAKFYYEQTIVSGTPSSSYDEIGAAWVSQCLPALTVGGRYYYKPNGGLYQNNTLVSSGNPTWTTGDTIGVALEHTGSTVKIWFRDKDGNWLSGNPATGTSPSFTITTTAEFFAFARGQWNVKHRINAGQDSYAHTAPSGFADLAIPDITQFEDLALDLSYIHDHAEDMRAPLHLVEDRYEDLPADLRLTHATREGDLPLAVNLCGRWRRSLALDLRLEAGEDLADLGARLLLSDGTALASLPVRTLLINQAPLYQAVIAQRLRSVKHA